ncbi:hypothetical protein GQS_01800 [Thermococcus sp. 4557]|uniref:hypothetical protein n=1 Tax=Thermococcus sp. (strain CGMCC 1.5172 / 4557) TaxID=1042877 RepID=UPI000219EC6A|nr:hypothetical protein [Thermococcus sp. 4557]AEK72262.1 hypothetical protein GQS_01800 [Thermococcus sp. 4557]
MPVVIDVPKDIEPLVREILKAVRKGRREKALKDLENVIQAVNQNTPEEIPDTLELLEELRER